MPFRSRLPAVNEQDLLCLPNHHYYTAIWLAASYQIVSNYFQSALIGCTDQDVLQHFHLPASPLPRPTRLEQSTWESTS